MSECTAIVVWTDKDPVLEAAWCHEFKQRLKNISLERTLKDLFFDGFDTYEDYEKYGDCFVHIDEPPQPSRMEDFIQLQDELIAKMAIPSDMMKSSSSQAAAKVHQEIMERRLGCLKRSK